MPSRAAPPPRPWQAAYLRRRLRALSTYEGGDGMADDFAQAITAAYATDGAALDLGRGVHDGAVVTAATVKLPLRMVNRHGLIAGATGTGKTKTLQAIAEQLSSAERVDNQSAREILASRMARRLRKLTSPGRPSPFGPR